MDAGTLYVVATPIGNLEDITFRAIRVLKEVAVVAAEDTRRTGLLLRHFDIRTPLVSLHAHNEGLRTRSLLERLGRGESVGLVSDAGTPGVSDPGAGLVSAARAAGVRVEPVPGASAVITAVSASGLEEGAFAFVGFPPLRSKDRLKWFERLDGLLGWSSAVFFEAPHRIQATLRELGNRSIDRLIVFRELTKLHESVYAGTPAEVLGAISPVAGEFTVVIPSRIPGPTAAEVPTEEAVVSMFGQITDMRAREAARVVAAKTGLSANAVYAIVRRARH